MAIVRVQTLITSSNLFLVGYRIDKSRTEYTNRAVLNLEKVQSADTGTYSCQVKRKDGKSLFKNMTLIVSGKFFPAV